MPGSRPRRPPLSDAARRAFKTALAAAPSSVEPSGASLLIYHRVGGGSTNELDCAVTDFERHLDLLTGQAIVSLDAALDLLQEGDQRPTVVLTFDDGFEDVYRNAWPLLRERQIPFTVYLATAYMGGPMVWEGATATGEPGRGMTWRQLEDLLASGLCTIGNHTHDHVAPADLDERQLDLCSAAIEKALGVTPRHFTYPWGIPVPRMEGALRARFRSASTGQLGRNVMATDPMRLHRIPVRRTDPPAFFGRKLTGKLWPEHLYAHAVRAAKGARSPSS